MLKFFYSNYEFRFVLTFRCLYIEKTIDKTLESNSFPKGFIVEAKMLIYISQKYKVQDKASDTDRLENNAISNLVDKMNRKLIVKILQAGSI